MAVMDATDTNRQGDTLMNPDSATKTVRVPATPASRIVFHNNAFGEFVAGALHQGPRT